jgi:hypothetical protein
MNKWVKQTTYSFALASLIPTLKNKPLSGVFLGTMWQTMKVQARDGKYFNPLSFHRSIKVHQNMKATKHETFILCTMCKSFGTSMFESFKAVIIIL